MDSQCHRPLSKALSLTVPATLLVRADELIKEQAILRRCTLSPIGTSGNCRNVCARAAVGMIADVMQTSFEDRR
jgi:hypothetical protein